MDLRECSFHLFEVSIAQRWSAHAGDRDQGRRRAAMSRPMRARSAAGTAWLAAG